jgi:hypothetical protein
MKRWMYAYAHLAQQQRIARQFLDQFPAIAKRHRTLRFGMAGPWLQSAVP